jgi:hypothetical protein
MAELDYTYALPFIEIGTIQKRMDDIIQLILIFYYYSANNNDYHYHSSYTQVNDGLNASIKASTGCAPDSEYLPLN